MSESIRVYRPGDEERIASLLRECFDTFRNYGLDGSRWLEYATLNEGFKLEGAYLLEVDNTLVSHIQVVEKRLRTAAGVLETAGIANVSTHPSWRGRGYATKLLAKAMEDYKAKGFPLTALFTGYASDPQRIYRRLGYVDVCTDRTWAAPIDDAQHAARKAEWIEVREADEKDLDRLVGIYETVGERYTGWPSRSRGEWIEKLFKRTAYHSFFYVERAPGSFVVAQEGGEVLGYAVVGKVPWNPREFAIMELVTAPGRDDALKTLFTYIVEKAVAAGARSLRASIPSEPPYSKLLKIFQPQGGGGVYMSEVLNFKTLVMRAAEKASKSLTETVKLELAYRGETASVKVGSGEASPHVEKADARVELDPTAFNRLLFGYCSALELLLSSTVKSSIPLRRVLEAVEAMFEPKPLHIWPVDHW
jgi:predicted acetyltransferase